MVWLLRNSWKKRFFVIFSKIQDGRHFFFWMCIIMHVTRFRWYNLSVLWVALETHTHRIAYCSPTWVVAWAGEKGQRIWLKGEISVLPIIGYVPWNFNLLYMYRLYSKLRMIGLTTLNIIFVYIRGCPFIMKDKFGPSEILPPPPPLCKAK